MPALTPSKGTSLFLAALICAAAAFALGRAGTASAQATPKPTVFEYTQREVHVDQSVDASNDLGKQGWEIYQAIPVWRFENDDLKPVRYVLFAKRRAPR
ncbi:MAG: hypothetical protein KGM43_06885 [Planctomycetota bacterium]|nr:hypothetical protein [Planctomycetota bacterium]